MNTEEFLDKLDKFIADTIGKEFEYKYETDDVSDDKKGIWFTSFYILGFDPEEDED